MLLSVSLGDLGVRFDCHVSMNVSVPHFIRRFPLWVSPYIRVAKPLFYGEIPVKLLNCHLPVGCEPCQFVWDMFIVALYESMLSRY